jgi:hypothetical protein
MEQIFNLHFSIFRCNAVSRRNCSFAQHHDTSPRHRTPSRSYVAPRRPPLNAIDAEPIEDVGFANTLTDARRASPSLYIAVCGRHDVSLRVRRTKGAPHLVSQGRLLRRGRVYYAKLAGGRSMFVAPV